MAIGAMEQRPLDAGPGIHASVSLKQSVGGKGKNRVENAFYFCPEMVAALVD